MALISRLLLLAVALPFVLATSNQCSSSEFYYKDADCCTPQGGPPSPPSPPAGSDCPNNGPGWSWRSDKNCCVPHQPNPPAPTCKSGWSYNSQKLCCEQNSPPPPSPPAQSCQKGYSYNSSSKKCEPNTPPPSNPPPSNPPPSTPGNCKSSEFYFPQKDCCLPSGGPPSPPPPPAGNNCPSSGWSWNGDKGCCAPHQPNPPTPSCPGGWTWNSGDLKCYPTPPSPPTPPPAHPSGKSNGYYKRHAKKSRTLCPLGLEACPLPGLTAGDYDCLDTTSELTSCGGCASNGRGQDCSALPGAWNVACEQAACKIYTCAQGFRLSLDGKSCQQL